MLNRVLMGITLVFFLAASCASEEKAKTHQERVENGEKLFKEHCDGCHPGGKAGKGPAIWIHAPGFVKRFQVRHGLGAMPAFKRKEISRDQLTDILLYIKTL